ncbi:MAG TPA: PQQ-binding-like beta-propeller repeat protein, partial [Fimbriiglobus sp.]|nr:PQQ-binding-like beta-propeller repeat protein [Fimbriiglobus sp.]
MSIRLRSCLFSVFFSALSAPSAVQSADWVHWRGPEQNGLARETGLPEIFDPNAPAGEQGVIWKQPYGGRSAPLVLKGRLYTISGHDMSKPTEGERVMCFDEKTGKVLWEKRFGVFHTDIVSSRLGWTTLTADPENERVYCHSTAGLVICFDKDGKELWKHSLTEEYGRISGYGGRIVSPIFDEGLVIVGMVNISWGEQARGGNRFVAFDGATGQVVWWAETPYQIRGTYYSNPVIAVVNGQRLLVSGGADGYVHGFKARTGERVFSYRFSDGVVNPSPVVDGNYLYISHGEENPEGNLPVGRVICLDISKVDPKTKEPKLVWEQKRLSKRFGLASAALVDGRLYVPDDHCELHCFRAKDGKLLWRVRYGTVSRGAPLVADGKLYVFDVMAKMAIYQLNGDKRPDELATIPFRRTSGPGFVETHGTPIAVNGRLYFLTQDALYCVGSTDAGKTGTYKPLPAEAEYKKDAPPTGTRVVPADVLDKPGEQVKFAVKYLDANGREVNAPADAKVQWSLPQPPLPKKAPKGASPPPPLNGEIADGTLTLGKLPRQQGLVQAKAGGLTAQARVRVAAQVPYTEDFEKVPVGAAPAGWVNAQSKYFVTEKDGNKVLSKVNTNSRPPYSRANGYITAPTASNYTIEADVLGTEVRGWMPDIGLVNCRYTLILDGKTGASGKRQVRIVSWEARNRVNVEADYDWQPGAWYRAKFAVVPHGKTATVRGKVWKKGEAEPAEWLLTYEDPNPNTEGAAALYGYIPDVSITPARPGSDVYFDNV